MEEQNQVFILKSTKEVPRKEFVMFDTGNKYEVIPVSEEEILNNTNSCDITEVHKRIRWRSEENLETQYVEDIHNDLDPTNNDAECDYSIVKHQMHPSLSSNMSTDSGCECEGEGPDSVYSTVSSCNSDILRMSLNRRFSDEDSSCEWENSDLFKQHKCNEQDEASPFIMGEDCVKENEQTEHRVEIEENCCENCEMPVSHPVTDVEVVSHVQSLKNEENLARGSSVISLTPTEECGGVDIHPVIHLYQCDEVSVSECDNLSFSARSHLTASSSTSSMPICRICHMPSGDGPDSLISPCRCSGSMQYIHGGCLMKWLEISSKRSKRPACCELCQYQYHRHKKFRVSHWQFPRCSRRDKLLHITFFISLFVMVISASITILCFKQDRGVRRTMLDQAELTESEIVTLTCGILFFLAFFIAMYVEVKARSTIYHLVGKFVYLNQQWYIDEYDKRKDVAPVSI